MLKKGKSSSVIEMSALKLFTVVHLLYQFNW